MHLRQNELCLLFDVFVARDGETCKLIERRKASQWRENDAVDVEFARSVMRI